MIPRRAPWKRLRLLGAARLRSALFVAALAATVITMLTSLPALADPSPTPPPPISTGPAPTMGQRVPTPEELAEIEKIISELNKRFSDAMQEAFLRAEEERIRKLLPDEGGLLAIFNATDEHGLPISAYTVKSDTGGLTDWDLGIENLITELAFMAVKWLIAFCWWLLGWALSFGLAKLLLTPVLSVANSLHTQIILQMGLTSLFLSVCALVCVARVFFGDRAKGWGDAALSLLLAAITATLLASPPATLLGPEDSALAVTRGVALEVADIILDAKPNQSEEEREESARWTSADAESISKPLRIALTDAFVVKPAMLLQYGRIFDGDCATKYSATKLSQIAFDREVSQYTERLKKYNSYRAYFDPQGAAITDWTMPIAKQWAVDHFGNPPMEKFEKECVPGDAKAARRASMDKVGGAIFLLVAAFIVTILVCGLSGSFLIAQCRLAWDAVRAEPALVAGILPGAGRGFLWDVGASILRSLGMLLVSVVGLAVLILIVQAVLDPAQQEWGQELTLRFIAVDVVCIGALKKRKALTARSKEVAGNFRAKMSAGRVGGTNGSVFTPASTPIAKNNNIGRTAFRGAVRTAMVGVSLAYGNPLPAIGYATSSSVSTVALMNRIQSGSNNGRGRHARPAGQVPQHGNPPQPPPQDAPQPAPHHPAHQPRPANTPTSQNLPGVPAPQATGSTVTTVPAGGPAATTSNPATPTPVPAATPRTTGQRARPRHTVPAQPAASPRQQQLRQRLDRGVQRQPVARTTSPAPMQRPTDASLARGEEQELNRRRHQRRRT